MVVKCMLKCLIWKCGMLWVIVFMVVSRVLVVSVELFL